MVYSEGYAGGNFGNGNGRGNSPIPVVRLGARLNEPGENKDHADAEDKANVEAVHSPPEESEPYVVEEKREELEREEADFVPIDDELAVIGVVDEQENAVVEESVLPVGHEEELHEIATASSGPDAESEPVKAEQVEAEESGAQSSSSGQEEEKQSLGEPEASQPQPQAETVPAESTMSEPAGENAEPEENAHKVNGAVEEPEDAKEAIESSTKATEVQNGESPHPGVDDKEDASEMPELSDEADSASPS